MIKKFLFVTAVVFFLNSATVSFFGAADQEPDPYCKVENAIISYEYYGLDQGTVKLSIKDSAGYVPRDETRIMK